MRNLLKKNAIFFILIVLTLFTIFWVFNQISRNQMVCWDEGNHMYVGNLVTKAIRQNNWSNFWQLSVGQIHYPFVQSWYLGFASLPFEYTVENSRLISLFLLLPTMTLIWLISQKTNPQKATGVLAVFLLLTSPFLLILYSMVLKEGLGTTLSLLVFFFYLLARQKKKIAHFLVTGFFLLVIMLTKYNFGVLVLAGLGLESIVWLITERKKINLKYWLFNLALYLPLAIGLALWIFFQFTQGQIAQIAFAFRQFMLPGPGEIFNLYGTDLLGHLLYYPLELAYAYTFSWLAFVVLLLGFFFSFGSWKDYKIRVLSLFFLVSFLAAEKQIVNNQGRYIATCVPFFFIVGSSGLVRLYQKVKKIKLKPTTIGGLIPLVIISSFVLIKDLVTFPKYLPGLASHEVLSAVFYQKDYLVDGKWIFTFDFDRNKWPRVLPEPGFEKIPDVMDFVINNVDLSKNIYFAGYLNELSPGLTSFYLDKAREKPKINNLTGNFQEYFVTIVVKDNTRFDTYAYRVFTNLSSLYAAKQVLADPSLTKITEKEFKGLGLTITVLGR